jgi:23S rRNA (adenine2503-C2)-methyltransferase
MKMNKSLVNLLALTVPEVGHLVQELGWPRYRTNQILQWLYQHRVLAIEGMTNLSKVDRERLQQVATVHHDQKISRQIARDGTEKF